MKAENGPLFEFIKKLSKKSKNLLEHYIKYEYISGIRTGKGKRKNFYEEHNSPEGVKIIKEVLKFKRLEDKIRKAEIKLRRDNKK